MAHRAVAPRRNRSAARGPLAVSSGPALPAMNASTATSPTALASQNRADGRSPARSTAATAVAAGRNAITTAPCAAVSDCSASDENSGKPTTTPSATIASERTCARVGLGARVARRYAAARTAAPVARPNATSHGSRSATARRVAGKEKLKPRMPRAPRTTPGPSVARVIPRRSIALSRLLMTNDNADDRVTQALRAAATRLAPGDRLPSVRDLMASHRASPITVQRAIGRLAGEGLVEPRPGRGTFVAARPARAAAAADLSWQSVALGARAVEETALQELLALPPAAAIPLTSGYLDADLQPLQALGAALARAGRRAGTWERGPVEGRDELRAWFAREAGGPMRAHDMVVCPGGQAAMATAFRALAGPGEAILVESPTYVGAIAAARAAGVRVVPVAADAGRARPGPPRGGRGGAPPAPGGRGGGGAPASSPPARCPPPGGGRRPPPPAAPPSPPPSRRPARSSSRTTGPAPSRSTRTRRGRS